MRITARIFFIVSLFTAVSPNVALAELRLSLKPDPITAATTSAVMIEISSLRLDISVIYPDAQRTPLEDNTLEDILGGEPIYDLSTAKQTLAHHFSLGIAAMDGSVSGASNAVTALAQSTDLFEMVAAIHEDDWLGGAWKAETGGGPVFGPPPEVVFIIKVDLPTALAVKRALEAQYSAQELQWFSTLNLVDYQAEAIAWVTTALRASRMLDVKRASNTPYAEEPLNIASHSALGWVFEAMVALSSRDIAATAARPLRGCSLRDQHVMRRFDGVSDNPIERFYGKLISDPVFGFSSATRFKLAVTNRDLALPFRSLIARAMRLNFDSAIRTATGSVLGDFAHSIDYMTAVLSTRIDPAVIDIYDCAAIVRNRGTSLVSGSILERKIAYRRMTADLDRIGAAAPKFFTAAETVTNLIGVGFVDPLTVTDASPYVAILSVMDDPFIDEKCAGLRRDDALIPSPRAQEILRQINAELYASVNLPVLLRLRDVPTGASVFAMPDPVTGRTLSPDLHPSFSQMQGSALPHDLRMVLAEQSYIERRLPELVDLSTPDGVKIAAELDRAQSALFCLQLNGVLNTEEARAHLATVQRSSRFMTAAVKAEIIAMEEANFGNYWWRVATGSAMVMVLYGRSEAEYLRYLEELIETETGKGFEKDLEDLSPQIIERLKEQLEGPLGSLGPAADGLRRGAEILFAGDFDSIPFWGCENGSVQRTPMALPGTLSDRERAIFTSGGTVLVLAYELGPDGALNADAKPDARDPGTCEAFRSRRARFAQAVSALDLSLPDTQWSADQPLMVFERSLAMRKLVGRLRPFIQTGQETETPLTGVDRIVAQIAAAHQRFVRFERHIAMLDILGGERLSPLPSLGLTVTALQDLDQNFDMLFPDDGIVLAGNGADTAAYEGVFEAQDRAQGISTFAFDLAEVFKPLEAAWAIGQNTLSPPRLAAGRFPALPFFPDGRAIQLGTAPGLDVGALAGLALPGVLGLDLTIDSRQRVTGDILLRLSSGRAPASLGATGGCEVTMVIAADEPGTATGCAAQHQVRDPDSLAQNDVQRLGFRILNMTVPDSCDTTKLEACALNFAHASAQDNILLDNRAFQAALQRIGIPSFVSFVPRHKNALVLSDDLADIAVDGTLTVAGFRLDSQFTRVELRKGGVWTNFNTSFVETAAQTIEAELASKFARAEAFLTSLRLPAEEDPETYFRFGPDLGDQGQEGIELALDWGNGKLNMRVIYALQGRGDLETPWREALSLRAGGELSLGPSGMERQRIVFDAPDQQEILDRLAALPVFDQIREASGGLVTVMPVAMRGDLRLRVAAQAEIEGCPVELAANIGLDLEGLEEVFENVGDTLAAQAANCAVGELAKGVNDLVEDQTVDILGVPFAITVNGENLLAGALDGNLPLIFTLQEEALADDGALGPCAALGDERSVAGIRFNAAPLALDFREMQQTEQELLGTMVTCRIEQVVPASLQKYFELKKVVVGHNLLAADIVLNDLPFLGTFALPRQNFSNMDTDIGVVLGDALGAGASQKLGEAIFEHMGGEEGIDLAGIGRVTLSKDSVAVDLFSDDPKISAQVTLLVYDIPVEADIEIAFARGSDALRVSIDENKALETAFQGLLGKVLEFVPEDTIKISNPRFGRLDDQGRIWGFVFGLKAEIPTEPGLIVGASRITISEQGISLGDKITGGASVPIPMGPVALSKVLVTLYTGEDGRESGVEVGADITAFDASLSHLVKLRALLDLREIDKPKFTAKGDLIVLNTLEVFEAEGSLDLSLFRVTLDAQTTDVLSDIIDYQSNLDADGSEQRFLASSGLDVLGIKLNGQELIFCVQDCDDGTGRDHTAQLSVYKNFLIGEGQVNAVTDLDFHDPQLEAGIQLDLFGWSPGGAKFSADLSRVLVGTRFLGVDLQAQTPSIKTMTPQLLIDMLKALFDISLEDLLKIRPDNISIAVMSGDGSTQTVHDGKAQDGDANASQASDGTGPTFETPEDAANTSPGAQEPGAPPPRGDGESAPEHTPWGQVVDANICVKPVGTPGNQSLNDPDAGARYYITSWIRGRPRPDPFERITPPGSGWSWWRLYTQSGIQALCDPSRFVLKEAVVGTNQRWRNTQHCSDSTPPRYAYRVVVPLTPDTDRSEGIPGLVNLHTQVACARSDGWRSNIWASWYYDANGDTNGGTSAYVVASRCPNGAAMDELQSASEEAVRACTPGVLSIPADEVPNSLGVKDLLHADDIYRLEVTHLRPWVEGKDIRRRFEQETTFGRQDIAVGELRYSATLHQESERGMTLRWHFLLRRAWQTEDGDTMHEVVPLVLEASDSLIAFRDRPAVMARILSLWLEYNRRPQVVAQQGNQFLVLADPTEYDPTRRAPPGPEIHDWLWQSAPDGPLAVRRVVFPLSLPVPGNTKPLSRGPSELKRDILLGIWEEVRRLPAAPKEWELLLGLNATTQSQTLAFVQLDNVPDPVVHLILNGAEPRLFSIAKLWDAQRVSPNSGDPPLTSAQRRRCSSVTQIGTSLSAFRETPLSKRAYPRLVRLALTQPAVYNRAPENLRGLPEPLVVLPADTCPEYIE